jgi:hypothetical protein
VELPDGSVAAILGPSGPVVIHNFDTGRSDTIGRRGMGPGEFAAPYSIAAWNGGLVAVLDAATRRLTLYRPTGIVDSVLPFPTPVGPTPQVDTCGNWWFGRILPGADSATLFRLSPGAPDERVISTYFEPARQRIVLGSTMLQLIPEYTARDIWGLAPRCNAWIARGGHNRLDYFLRDSAQIGMPMPYKLIRTSDEDRHKWLGLPASPLFDTLPREMATTKAPFQDVRVAPDGSSWFWLNQPVGYRSELYTAITRPGAAGVRVQFPGPQKILAIGAAHLYTVAVAEDGRMTLLRHRRPRQTLP